MKIALLSFHNAYNYGAALQAYALQYFIEQIGVECEYINYVNVHRRQAYDMKFQFKEALSHKKYIRAVKVACGSVLMQKRKKNFDCFYFKYLKKTNKTYTSSIDARILNDEYDKFVVGSDQVWNPFNNGSDTAFLLDFVVDSKKKISYSSSFGLDKIPSDLRQNYIKCLNSFNRLSVRENAGVNIIKNLCGKDAHLVLDPVFLPKTEMWKSLAMSVESSKDKYLFFYTNNESQIDEFLSIWNSDVNHHILSSHVKIKDFLNSRTKIMFSMSPEKFLNEIINAEMVITASFHCLAFAIILHKPFMVFLTGNHGKDERLINLLKIAGLESRIIDGYTTKEKIFAKIDYEDVDKRLTPYLDKSKKYLYNAIYSEEDIPFEPDLLSEETRFCCDDRCTGCSACKQICPHNAIDMKITWDGFLKPIVDEHNCIQCGLCSNVCQVFNTKEHINVAQRYYGVKMQNEIRIHSSSGGAFTSLSDYILESGGCVAASVMDSHFKVKFEIADNMVNRDKMRNTFYVQSDSTQIYTKVKEQLNSNKKVMFVGTSCQVEGLYLYLQKDYENLFTCDLICHGVPSPAAFDSFIDYLKSKGELSDFKFRDKSLGWGGYNASAVINNRKVTRKQWLNSFNVLFSHNVINRTSCSMCSYASLNRPADITIGDFWKIKKRNKSFYDNLGVSLVIVNTEKGIEWFKSAKFPEVIEFKKEDVLQNSLLSPSESSTCRSMAFKLLNNSGYETVAKKYGEYNIKGKLKNIVRRLMIKV